MAAAMILEATHTHLYPGHRGKVSGLTQVSDLQGGDCVVEFSDGSATPARISESEDGCQLRTDAYHTAAGTKIAEKYWRIYLEDHGDRVEFRILKKVGCPR